MTLSYPGVYITEIPSGTHTIVGVATSITAFVGSASRGPVDEPVTIFSFGDFERIFGGLDRRYGLGYLVRDFYLNGGGEAIIVRVASRTGTDAAATAHASVDGTLDVRAVGPGDWGNSITVTVTHPSADVAASIAEAQGVTAADLFTLTVTDGVTTETFRNVTVVEGPRRVDLVLASSQLVETPGALPADPPADGSTALSGGADGGAIIAGDYLGDQAAKTGLYALLNADLVNIVCFAPPAPDGDVPDGVWADALAFCAPPNRRFLIIEPPADMTVDAIKAWSPGGVSGTSARNAATYFPRLRYGDPEHGGAVAEFPNSGAVAGIYARTDATRGVWKAPAGQDAGIVGTSALSVPVTDDENGELNPVAINCLRTFRDVGSVVWGARTLRGQDVLGDDYKYVPIRRLALFLEETLYRSTQWVVFEPNDEPLWSQIRASIGAFMQDLFRRGAFQGTTPRDAYFVQCDSDTTTQYDIDRGVVNIRVGFAPLKPAEFVVISIQQLAAGAAG